MHDLHHPSGDGTDALIATVRARVRRMATAGLWAQRLADANAELREKLHAERADNAVLREEVRMWRRMAGRHVGGADVPPLPDEYVRAVRAGDRHAAVTIDGMPCVVSLPARAPGIDPRRELDDWATLVRSIRSAREEIRGLDGDHA